MKDLNSLTKKQKSKTVAATPKKQHLNKLSSHVLMPEKLALANQLLKGVKIP